MGKPKSVDALFADLHDDRAVIILFRRWLCRRWLCRRWCLRFKLSARNLVEMMAERGPSMAHATLTLPDPLLVDSAGERVRV